MQKSGCLPASPRKRRPIRTGAHPFSFPGAWTHPLLRRPTRLTLLTVEKNEDENIPHPGRAKRSCQGVEAVRGRAKPQRMQRRHVRRPAARSSSPAEETVTLPTGRHSSWSEPWVNRMRGDESLPRFFLVSPRPQEGRSRRDTPFQDRWRTTLFTPLFLRGQPHLAILLFFPGLGAQRRDQRG
jgi:hypothetical protein